MTLANKLHERLHVGRVALRVYDALLAKPQDATRGELEALRDDARRHVALLERALRGSHGGAPPSVASFTPVGEAMATVIADPHTGFAAGIDLALMLALAGEEAWDRLVAAADEARHALLDELRAARDDARRHVARLRAWSRANLPARAIVDDDFSADQAAGAASSVLPL